MSSAQQPWEKSLGRARIAFKRESPTVSFFLFQALADAYRMADYCHDRLLNIKREPLSDTSVQEWDRFLGTLYKDASKVYLKYSDLVRLANAQTTFARPDYKHHRDFTPLVPLADNCLLAAAA